MTDDQFKQLIAAIKALQKHLEEHDKSTAIDSIETDVAKLQKDISEIKSLLENR
jgi:ribosomal protein S15P/S13E